MRVQAHMPVMQIQGSWMGFRYGFRYF